MSKTFIKRILATVALSIVLSLQLVSPVLAATSNETVLAAAQKGVDYLNDGQNADGSIVGLGDVTDWAVIAVAANGDDPAAFANGGDSAIEYMHDHPLSPAALATDVEKRILAIVAADEDTTNFGGVDYNALLATYHNNDQIGNETLLNDDIFGIIAIAALNDPTLTAMAQDALDYLLANQDASGGFSYTTESCAYCGPDSNDTAAAIIAMQAAEKMGLTHADLDQAQADALNFLLDTQQDDGGFAYDQFSPSDGSSTAWSLMALNSLDESVASEATLARDWLLANQNTDGGFSFAAYGYTDSDVSVTAHAVIAILGTTWTLLPEPIQPAPVAPTPAPTPAPTAVLVTYSSPQPTPTPAPAPTPAPQDTTPAGVLNEQTPPTEKSTETPATPETPGTEEQKKPKPNYTLFAVAILILVATVWYVLQSKPKQGK